MAANELELVQVNLLGEEVILLDEDDICIGHASKLDSHTVKEGCDRTLLHRAFSVFLFDKANKLVLQRRASMKPSFPLLWTNTCCSHPLFSIPTENQEDSGLGVKHAALRRMEFELGIPINTFSISDLALVSRLRYFSQSLPMTLQGKQYQFAENEIDYVLILKTEKEINIMPNPAEVDSITAISIDELPAFLERKDLTPWFRAIASSFLPEVWSKLIKSGITQFLNTDHSNLPPIVNFSR
ncbi:putative Isopentenyl-diphosphate Delta-isomerase 1 [Blattamonas nauphoetae]|uniref:isopentenyl-diphosphate Delta-isomerase n=1 Tax=Blattamonas nauphoetae TaxID=2049346 RepID=A0ABQ9YLB0_9EUKA|nr:putative Isopentenyl-diphosphate Delta-isomerase 1 [Blattamonas nauphoetae]